MEEDYISLEIASAFNAGYTLQKHNPQLLDKLLQSNDGNSAYMDALAKGKQQHEREKIIEHQQRIKRQNQQKKRSR